MGTPVKPKKQITINPVTGQLDLVTGNNFSYESIPSGKKLKIRENEQMIVHESFSIDGEFDLDGTLIVEE
jgi:hypothetical protein